MTSETDHDVYRLLLQLGTSTINNLARRLGRKHETIARAVQRLEETGKVNVLKSGNVKYVSLRPDSHTKRVRPALSKMEGKRETKNDPYARGSCPPSILRYKTVAERVPIEGGVLHPRTRGCDVGREWVRAHVNGMYNVQILAVGDFKPYNRNDDVAIEWTTSHLNTNTAYNGKLFLKGDDGVAFSIRAVTGEGGALSTLSVYVHPRYVFHKGHEATALAEFRQQVIDVCEALRVHGWQFDYDTIELKGELHTAINDTVLGSHVGRYISAPGDKLHFDHSHGIPECEVYGSDPDTVELMVNLPDTLRAMGESLDLLRDIVSQIIELQTQTVTLMVPKPEETRYDVMFR